MATNARHELDPAFKQILITSLSSLPIIIRTEVEVSRLPRTIDVLILAESAESQLQLLDHTPLPNVTQHNQIEFKGQNDPLNMRGYSRILGRTHLYIGDSDGVNLDEMSVTIVCAGKPRKLLSNTLPPHTFADMGDGVYKRDGFPHISIIVINELPITETNYPMLLFASSERKFRQFLTQALVDDQLQYISYAYAVRPQVTKELLRMGKIFSIPRENLEFIAEDIGDQLMEFFSIEQRLQGISSEQRLQGISSEQRLQGISSEQRLQGISPEQFVKNLTPEELMAMMRLAQNRLWDSVQVKKSAQERIDLITEMSKRNQSLILDEGDREKLLEGLSSSEQKKLLMWIETNE